MENRKKYVIDKNFQYRVTFKILALILFLVGIITIGIGIHATNNNNTLKKTVSKLQDTITDQNHIIQAMKEYPEFAKLKERRIASQIISSNLDENVDLMHANVAYIQGIIRMNNLIIIFILIFVIIQSVILYVYLIRKTNTISGPVFAMNRHIQKILNGENSEISSLRKNDEFKELFDSLSELTARYGELKTKK
ncbi:MAG: hypothetical protein CVV44_00895 [Spirochaetae bacterium HGW-Spirochaetae-1]|jgi:nitrate/nitrite-specific signal transduction histidine kinase|nr:MAG: hypothetical protein CVV44_00895 [Spirochaetae bacterium HGW-Spirochaetae-1]